MILDDILRVKKREIEEAKQSLSLKELTARASGLMGNKRDFKGAISAGPQLNLIAEIKQASPSGGVLREEFDPLGIACIFEASGAAAISILTDKEFFQGELDHLNLVKDAVALPVLRKDFIIDSYQVYESACAGADALLLIARILNEHSFKELYTLCRQMNIDVLCEVHDQRDLDKVLACGARIIGINNRDLDTLREDLGVTAALVKKVPPGKIIVSESGIKTAEDVERLKGLGLHAVLIGETFMRSPDIATKVKELMGA